MSDQTTLLQRAIRDRVDNTVSRQKDEFRNAVAEAIQKVFGETGLLNSEDVILLVQYAFRPCLPDSAPAWLRSNIEKGIVAKIMGGVR